MCKSLQNHKSLVAVAPDDLVFIGTPAGDVTFGLGNGEANMTAAHVSARVASGAANIGCWGAITSAHSTIVAHDHGLGQLE